MNSFEQLQKTKFMIGVYNPLLAANMISSIIDAHINFYKLQFLSQWEADHSISTEDRDKKIGELKEKKKQLRSLIEQSKEEGGNISLEGIFEIKLVK